MASKFTSRLKVSPHDDGRTWTLLEPFEYTLGDSDISPRIIVPEGFETDFASIPRPFWGFIPRWGKHGNAAVLHDWLYWDQRYYRGFADYIFLEAMGVLETKRITKWLMYYAVRLFGWLSWRGNKKKKKNGLKRVIPL